MDDRLPSLALLLITAGMLLACIVGMSRLPEQRAAIQGTESITYRIDPNQADAEMLCLLPRIGPGIAQRIIDDREIHGYFQDARDLSRVYMVGDKTVAALEPWVTFDSTKK